MSTKKLNDNVEIEINENGDIQVIDFDIMFPASKNYPKHDEGEWVDL